MTQVEKPDEPTQPDTPASSRGWAGYSLTKQARGGNLDGCGGVAEIVIGSDLMLDLIPDSQSPFGESADEVGGGVFLIDLPFPECPCRGTIAVVVRAYLKHEAFGRRVRRGLVVLKQPVPVLPVSIVKFRQSDQFASASRIAGPRLAVFVTGLVLLILELTPGSAESTDYIADVAKLPSLVDLG
jgi:hypothetical protein